MELSANVIIGALGLIISLAGGFLQQNIAIFGGILLVLLTIILSIQELEREDESHEEGIERLKMQLNTNLEILKLQNRIQKVEEELTKNAKKK